MTEQEKKLLRETELQKAYDNMKAVDGQAQPKYEGTYDKETHKALEALNNREKFNYNPGTDPIYQQYKSDYISQGRLAMKDTLGQTAALTGGYASSYGQSAARQSYDAYLQNLSAIVPELYSLAYSKYKDQGEEMERKYTMLKDSGDKEYKAYEDKLSQYNSQKRQAYNDYQSALSAYEKEKEREYNRQKDEALSKAKYGDFSGYGNLYGQQTAQGMKNAWIAANPLQAYNLGLISPEVYYAMSGKFAPGHEPAATGGKGGTYYPNKAPDGRDAKIVQAELRNKGYNIAVDGAWGPKSQAAWDKAYSGGGADKDRYKWL